MTAIDCPRVRRTLAFATAILIGSTAAGAQLRLGDESDRAAFRSWFVLLADAQFEERAPDVTDCAALVRFAFREALRAHTTEWRKHVRLPFTPTFPDVRSAPVATSNGWPLFRVADGSATRYAEFADAKTIVTLNARPLGRNLAALQPGDLLYFRQPGHTQPDHLMIFVGRSFFDEEAEDWIVYHTGPLDGRPGEVRKVRLADLLQHPAPRWRPLSANPHFIGAFRLAGL
jgi:uncharacterized protein YfaT (DUF1175 family)